METVAERYPTVQDSAEQSNPGEVAIRQLLLNEPVRMTLRAIRIPTTRTSTGGRERKVARGHGSREIALLDTCETAAEDVGREDRKHGRRWARAFTFCWDGHLNDQTKIPRFDLVIGP